MGSFHQNALKCYTKLSRMNRMFSLETFHLLRISSIPPLNWILPYVVVRKYSSLMRLHPKNQIVQRVLRMMGKHWINYLLSLIRPSFLIRLLHQLDPVIRLLLGKRIWRILRRRKKRKSMKISIIWGEIIGDQWITAGQMKGGQKGSGRGSGRGSGLKLSYRVLISINGRKPSPLRSSHRILWTIPRWLIQSQ